MCDAQCAEHVFFDILILKFNLKSLISEYKFKIQKMNSVDYPPTN